MSQAKHFNELLNSKEKLHRKKDDMTVSLSCFFAGKKSTASAHLHTLTMFTTKLSFNSEDFKRTQLFTFESINIEQTSLTQVQTEFPVLSQKRETGKLNKKQQLTTLG